MDKNNKEIEADEARALAVTAQESSLEGVFNEIRNRAEQGFNEAVLWNQNIGLSQVQKLIKLGYLVGTTKTPMNTDAYMISW